MIISMAEVLITGVKIYACVIAFRTHIIEVPITDHPLRAYAKKTVVGA